jgi:AAA15 family ATPase/GTPase
MIIRLKVKGFKNLVDVDMQSVFSVPWPANP